MKVSYHSEGGKRYLSVAVGQQKARTRVVALRSDYLSSRPHLSTVVDHYTSIPAPHLVQFLVDPSVLPLVICLEQEHGEEALFSIFYLTRTYCYSIHQSRLKALGLI